MGVMVTDKASGRKVDLPPVGAEPRAEQCGIFR